MLAMNAEINVHQDLACLGTKQQNYVCKNISETGIYVYINVHTLVFLRWFSNTKMGAGCLQGCSVGKASLPLWGKTMVWDG